MWLSQQNARLVGEAAYPGLTTHSEMEVTGQRHNQTASKRFALPGLSS